MTKTVKARFIEGAFKPLEELALPEGIEVTVTINTEETATSNWAKISEIFREADSLDLKRASHESILANLRDFRESS